MVGNVVSRSYEPDDFEACLKIFDTNVPRFFRTEERVEYASFLRNLPGPYLLLVDASDHVVGCGGYAIREDDNAADLCWGMVRADLHGHGLGRKLTKLRIDGVLQDPEVGQIVLNTSQHTAGFYESMGFRTTDLTTDGYGPGLDRCEMRLTVSRTDPLSLPPPRENQDA